MLELEAVRKAMIQRVKPAFVWMSHWWKFKQSCISAVLSENSFFVAEAVDEARRSRLLSGLGVCVCGPQLYDLHCEFIPCAFSSLSTLPTHVLRKKRVLSKILTQHFVHPFLKQTLSPLSYLLLTDIPYPPKTLTVMSVSSSDKYGCI